MSRRLFSLLLFHRYPSQCRYGLITMVGLVIVGLTGCQDEPARFDNYERSIEDLLARNFLISTTMCEYRCESNYQSCHLNSAISSIELSGPGPARAPGPELPGCWPDACEDDTERELAEDSPQITCAAIRDRCLAACSQQGTTDDTTPTQ